MKWLNLTLTLLLLWALYQLQFGDGGRQAMQAKQQLLADQETEIKQLQSRNQKLEAEVASLKQGLDAIEERARSELGMIKDDETFIQVINQDDGN